MNLIFTRFALEFAPDQKINHSIYTMMHKKESCDFNESSCLIHKKNNELKRLAYVAASTVAPFFAA